MINTLNFGAFLLLLFIFIYINIRGLYFDYQTLFFQCAVISCLIPSFCEAFSGYVQDPAIIFAYNEVYFFCRTSTLLFYTLYLLALVGRIEGTTKWSAFWLSFGPVMLGEGLVLTNPWTHWIFTVDQYGVYHREPYQFILYLLALYYIVIILIYCYLKREVLAYDKKVGCLVCLLCAVIPVTLNVFWPELRIQEFGLALSALAVMLTIEKPLEYLEPVTRLLNQTAFRRKVQVRCYNMDKVIIVTIHLAHFPYMMHVFGYTATNQMLNQMARFLEDQAQWGDLVCYDGQGNFQVLFRAKDTHRAYQAAKTVQKRFDQGWKSNSGETLSIEVTILLSRYPEDIDNYENLINVMNVVHKSDLRKNQINYLADISITKKQKKQVVSVQIANAIRNDSFEVFYQPIYCAETNGFGTAEALVRMRGEDQEFIPPDVFIPLAEGSGSILEIDRMVLKKVCLFIKQGGLEQLGVRRIHVNLSAVECMYRDQIQEILKILEEYRIPKGMIQFEITETAAASTEVMGKNVAMLSQAGFPLALDDYGTGFANLDYLMNLNFDIIKLDKTLVWKAMEEDNSKIVLDYIVQIIHKLGKETVAEGVETQEQNSMMKEAGCDYQQGYFYAKPMPMNEYLDFLKEQRGGSSN